MVKAVILIGGPQKGTRFRPLSLDLPKPLFPVAGFPTIQHHIEACCKVPGLDKIFLIGYYTYSSKDDDKLYTFMNKMSSQYNIDIEFLQEYTQLGTAGGIYKFREHLESDDDTSNLFILMHGDVCGEFPLVEMLQFHLTNSKGALITIMGTEATRQQSLNYGCIVEDKETHEVLHYAEKPSTFVSTIINCGVYICSLDIFKLGIFNRIENAISKGLDLHNPCHFDADGNRHNVGMVRLEQEILLPLAGSGKLFVYHTDGWWSQMKTAGSAIYANKHYLELYHKEHPERFQNNPKQVKTYGDVYIDPSADVHYSAVLGPNVSIGKNVEIGSGVRIKESIILDGAKIEDNSVIMYSIIGWSSIVGKWCRIEGTPCDPNPNKPFAKMENLTLFNSNGRLNPSITVLGSKVRVPSETLVLNSIVLPHKELGHSYKNEIIL
ncbi:hypothetical protein CHUAL_000867 [Chamberlinius hualienensis]